MRATRAILLGSLAALLAVQALFGSLPVVAKIAFQGFGAMGVAAWRIGGAALVFAIWARIARIRAGL